MHGLTPAEVSIYVGGDYNEARRLVRQFCYEEGSCFTVTPTSYIYTGGEEAGTIVGLIQYPRFPATEQELWDRARRLADVLLAGLCQKSCTVSGVGRVEIITWGRP